MGFPNLPDPRTARVRCVAAAACGLVGLAIVGSSFWRLDLRYALPTPVPNDHSPVAAGAPVALPNELQRRVANSDRPTLLHFYNPACPCSRFNLDHVRGLAKRFEREANFIAVLECEPEDAAQGVDALSEPFGHTMFDPDGSIAALVGVYSTPQAAILTPEGRLYWRGNYNVSRYCANPESEFARIALERVCAGSDAPAPDARAQTAWGCPLPDPTETAQ